jgi:hypothetical protein
VPLIDIFDGRFQLNAYFHMWHTGRPAAEQCEGCTFNTSHITELAYLHSRDVSYAVFCEGPYEEASRYRDFVGYPRSMVLGATGLRGPAGRKPALRHPGGISPERSQSLRDLLDHRPRRPPVTSPILPASPRSNAEHDTWECRASGRSTTCASQRVSSTAQAHRDVHWRVMALDPERARLASLAGASPANREQGAERTETSVPWHRWGPYLAERQWSTVREDYSPDRSAWDFFPHEHARSRAYRWGQDGLLGWCDDQMRLCFALALWNGRGRILKERLFGLTGPEGNHGEDVKEIYYFLDGTPTHSYMRALYRYPQRAFPYADLLAENHVRTHADPEFELLDTGVFADNRYFDVLVEYAKSSPSDTLVRVTVTNLGPHAAELHLIPTLWFRNTWAWGDDQSERARLRALGDVLVHAAHPTLGDYWLACQGRPTCCSPKTSQTHSGYGAFRIGRAMSKTESTMRSSAAAPMQ